MENILICNNKNSFCQKILILLLIAVTENDPKFKKSNENWEKLYELQIEKKLLIKIGNSFAHKWP